MSISAHWFLFVKSLRVTRGAEFRRGAIGEEQIPVKILTSNFLMEKNREHAPNEALVKEGKLKCDVQCITPNFFKIKNVPLYQINVKCNAAFYNSAKCNTHEEKKKCIVMEVTEKS